VNTLRVGIASREMYKKRTMAIARVNTYPQKMSRKSGLNLYSRCPSSIGPEQRFAKAHH